MALNVEVKARVLELSSLETALRTKTGSAPAILHQEDTFFTVCKGRLKLRCDPSGRGEVIYYLREDGPGPVVSRYFRTPLENASKAKDELMQMFGLKSVVRKRRKLFLIGRTRVHLDEVEGLGEFMELEVVLGDDEPLDAGVREAEGLMARLQVQPSQLIDRAYIDLLAERSR